MHFVSWCMLQYIRTKVTKCIRQKIRCTFISESLNHIHQDTKPARLITVCKHSLYKQIILRGFRNRFRMQPINTSRIYFNTHETMAPSRGWQEDRNVFSVIFHIRPRFQVVVRASCRFKANSRSVYVFPLASLNVNITKLFCRPHILWFYCFPRRPYWRFQ